MITKGIISKIGGHVINASGSAETPDDGDGDATESGDMEDVTSETTENISLTEEEGKFVYKVKGSLKQKFLGLLPVDLEREVTVSAETGEVTSVEESLLAQILNALSI